MKSVVLLVALGALGAGTMHHLAHGRAHEPVIPVFQGAKPVRIAFTGYMDGKLEPCGCASAQSGGVDRRSWWLKLNKHRIDLKLEGGNLVRRNDPLERTKMMWIQEILGTYMGYSVFPLGPKDLSLGAEELANYVNEDGGPFLVSDLRKVDSGASKAPYLIHSIQRAGAYKVCVLSLAGPGGKPAKGGYEILAPDRAVAAALAAAGPRGKAYDLCVVFVNFGKEGAARELAKTLPGVDLIVGFADNVETKKKPEVYARDAAKAGVARTQVLFPGWRGKKILLWEARPDGAGWTTTKTHVEDLAVPPNTPKGKRPEGSDPEVWNMLIASKQQIGEDTILEDMAEVRPTKNGARYLGDLACKKCHEQAYEDLKLTRHNDAWQSLQYREKNDGWPVTRHPDCVVCHVVGYGEKSGFVNFKKTPHLVNVGCEACHGAGSKHVAVWQPVQKLLDSGGKVSAEKLAATRKAGLLGKVGPKGCEFCHDFEQSPGFDFNDAWESIEHGK